jgi:hypothetical protein
MTKLRLSPTIRRWIPVLAACGGLLVLAAPTFAQNRAPIVPTSGAWCGITDDGRRVSLRVSDDAAFVLWAAIDTERGTISSTGANSVRGVSRAQVADSKFIFRQQADETRCERGDIRSPGINCRVVTQDVLTIRGTVKSPVTIPGSFAANLTVDPNAGGRDPGRGGQVRRYGVNGSYDAWPAGSAPCP